MKIAAILIVVLIISSIGLSIYLPYSTSIIETVSTAERNQDRVGPLHWSDYSKDPAFTHHRKYFELFCKGLLGRAAGECLGQVFADTVPFGSAPTEFLQSDFNPSEALADHMGGKPAECVSRSALAATILLANGIRAQVVQFVNGKLGHTVISVLDESEGWVVLDLTFNTALSVDGRRDELSLWNHPDQVQVDYFAPRPAGLPNEMQPTRAYFKQECWNIQ